MKLTIVIPVYNEEESLPTLMLQIESVCQANRYSKEVIFVDDGSQDSSWTVIKNLASTYEDVRAIRFRRNFGKAAALDAGFQCAAGDFVFTMDADLQDDPNEIPRFLAKMDEGFDVVSGWKQNRHDPKLGKVLPSRIFNAMVSTMTGVHLHDHNCGFKCYRNEVVREIHIYGEQHRFVPVLAAARGFRVGEIVVNHRKRQFGHSKYGFARFIKGFFDLLTVSLSTKYGQRPLHVMGTLGLLLMLIGFLFENLPEFLLVLGQTWLRHYDLLVLSLGNAVLNLGEMFLVAGFAAELLANFHQHPQASNYAISERLTTLDTPPQNAVLPPLRIDEPLTGTVPFSGNDTHDVPPLPTASQPTADRPQPTADRPQPPVEAPQLPNSTLDPSNLR